MTDSVTVEQCDRDAAADILDEIASLTQNDGIGQVADLIRDGEYDEHDTVLRVARHRIAERERCEGIAEDFGASPGTMGPALVTRRAIAQAIREHKP